MTKVNIFEDAKEKVVPTWMKFVNANDSVQGTYVGKLTGIRDSYGNEQIAYQLLQDDGTIINVGFGLNKKVLHQDMERVNFGQIVGFKYKGKITVKDKRSGTMVEVKDYSIYQDPKIVNAKWMKENEGNMPETTFIKQGGGYEAPVETDSAPVAEDVPFSSKGSLTNEDKLAIIEKLAKDKLGSVDSQTAKEKVMEVTGIAFIPVNYDKIVEKLTIM